MGGILIAIAVASFIAAQAAMAGAGNRIVVPVAAGLGAAMAALWTLALGTLDPHPGLWEALPRQIAGHAVAAAAGAGFFTLATANLLRKMTAFRQKHPHL